MEHNGVTVEQFRAIDHDVASGVYPDMTEHGGAPLPECVKIIPRASPPKHARCAESDPRAVLGSPVPGAGEATQAAAPASVPVLPQP